MTSMTRRLVSSFAAAASAVLIVSPVLAAEGDGPEIVRQQWAFSGFRGQFDQAQLQRGFQVYKEVCAACHGLNRVNFRNLVQPGGPGFPEEAVKALAAEWPNQITDGPNDEGKMFERPASLIAKARGVARNPSWWTHPFLMLGDIVKSYQEGGSDYLFALLTGYTDPPADVKVGDGMYYNKAFPGHQLAMPTPLQPDQVAYSDGTKPTVENYAKDVAAFLAWSADPTHDQRKRIGWQVMLYLLVTTALLYLGKKRIWADVKH